MLQILYIFNLYLHTAYIVLIRNTWLTRKFLDVLQKQLAKHSTTLDSHTANRIHFYTKQSALTNLWFSTLRNTTISDAEQKQALYLGAITPLADDLIDELNFSSSEIIHKVESINTSSSAHLILLNFLYKGLKQCDNEQLMLALQRAMNAQNSSVMQQNSKLLSTERLLAITKEKGASATLLYRCILANSLKTNEQQAIESLGFALQLINDMFDIHKDLVNGQQTLFTNTKLILEPIDLFETVVNESIRLFCKLSYPKKAKLRFLNLTAILFARGFVCAEMLKKLNKARLTWDLASFDRKELICDMEKISNLRLSVKYSGILNKQIKQVLKTEMPD